MRRTICIILITGVTAATSAAHARQASATASEAASTACEHRIEESQCPFCTPGRIEQLGACREHGVPEALCVECRPFLKEAFIANGDWCSEHGTPESQCELCNPSLASAAGESPSAGAARRWQREPSATCSTSSTEVTLASPSIARTAGFEYAAIRESRLAREIERNAEVTYNANRYARLSSRASGVIVEVLKDLGDRVSAGEPIALIDSTELGTAKADLLQARELLSLREANATRETDLMDKGASTERDMLEAQTHRAEARIAVARARQRLRNLGLSDQKIDQVEKESDTSSMLEVVAPFSGTLVERTAVIGEVVDPRTMLFSIADTSTVWAMIDLIESDLAAVRAGQPVLLTIEGLSSRPFPGTLAWVSTQLDHRTRTIRARAELDNADGMLRAFMFGRATVVAGENRQAVTVPKSAVQWEGCCNVAFVRASEDGTRFKPARLTLGFDAGDRYEVLAGLSGGQTVVTRGSFVLKNEILKDSIGAGCCEVDYLAK